MRGEGRQTGVPVPVSSCVSLRKVAQDPRRAGLQGGPRGLGYTLGSLLSTFRALPQLWDRARATRTGQGLPCEPLSHCLKETVVL